jgi:hypothetical protein
MKSLEAMQYTLGWELNKGHETEDEGIVLQSKEQEQEIFNRVAFGGERILYNFNGAEVAIVPLEDYAVLEGMDQ